MDFEEIKKIAGKLGTAVIVGRDDSVFVLMSYEKFLELSAGEGSVRVNRQPSQSQIAYSNGSESNIGFLNESKDDQTDQMLIEKLNQDIAILKEQIRLKELAEMEDVLD